MLINRRFLSADHARKLCTNTAIFALGMYGSTSSDFADIEARDCTGSSSARISWIFSQAAL